MTTLSETAISAVNPTSVASGQSAPKIYLKDVELAKRQGRLIKILCNQRVNGDRVSLRKFGSAVRYDLPEVESWDYARARKSTSNNGCGR